MNCIQNDINCAETLSDFSEGLKKVGITAETASIRLNEIVKLLEEERSRTFLQVTPDNYWQDLSISYTGNHDLSDDLDYLSYVITTNYQNNWKNYWIFEDEKEINAVTESELTEFLGGSVSEKGGDNP